MTFSYPIKIRERHLDTFGHVNNATYLEIFEEARWEIINSRGYGIGMIKKSGLGPVILEINIKFLKEMKLHDQIFVKSEPQEYKGKVGTLKQWMENDKGDVCCEATFAIGLFDLSQRRLATPTKEWLNAIGLS